MNIFRLIGDLSHLAAILLLLLKIWRSRSVSGISGKSQLLFAGVFLTRYLDLFFVFVSLYNTVMKLDTFRAEILVIASAGLACLINHEFSPLELLWTFSIYLESVAILPQLFLISKTGEAETITSHYLFALGSYRALYILNWIYRLVVEGQYDVIAIAAGCLQTALYADFFYLYVTIVLKGRAMSLPA
uniref:ER lumen protein-retaining receptor n=1 Tax=Macrostomum lignano TaxID=282301 RepID=A0A1I8IDL6_9PLAT